MKKVSTIVLAGVIAIAAGLWFMNSIGVLNQQAQALEENAEIIHELDSQVLDYREEKPLDTEVDVDMEEEIQVVIQPETKVSSMSAEIEEIKEEKKPFSESIVKESAFKLANSLNLGDEYGKVEGYDNKRQFINDYFLPFMAKNMAHFFVDDFFYDEADGLYIVGQFAPHLLDPERDFEVTQVDTDYYVAVQSIIKLDPQDASTVTYKYEYNEDDNNWVIWGISYE